MLNTKAVALAVAVADVEAYMHNFPFYLSKSMSKTKVLRQNWNAPP